jgi:hypothetical protein
VTANDAGIDRRARETTVNQFFQFGADPFGQTVANAMNAEAQRDRGVKLDGRLLGAGVLGN